MNAWEGRPLVEYLELIDDREPVKEYPQPRPAHRPLAGNLLAEGYGFFDITWLGCRLPTRYTGKWTLYSANDDG